MANIFNHNFIPRRLAAKYNSFAAVISKVQKNQQVLSLLEKLYTIKLRQNLQLLKVSFLIEK